jgi:hypothetical protein
MIMYTPYTRTNRHIRIIDSAANIRRIGQGFEILFHRGETISVPTVI